MDALKQAQDMIESGAPIGASKAGKMYQVAIKAPPEHFLDWDKPLSEQPEHFQRLKDAGIIDDKSPPYQKTGQATPQAVLQMPVEKGSMEARLREAGIPGIKYLDQGSRPDEMRIVDRDNITARKGDQGPFFVHQLGKEVGGPFHDHSTAQQWMETNRPKQTRNFVVFDDKLIDILKKYGIAGLAALPAMNAYHHRTQPVDHDPFAP